MITVHDYLTLSSPILLRLYTLPFLINGGLDHCGTEPFEQQQFGTAGDEGVNY